MDHLLKIQDLSRAQIEELIEGAEAVKKDPASFQKKLAGKIVATLFFEASTRTRLSFDAAAQRLGARVIGFADAGSTSYSQKGESLEDTIQVVSRYADLIVMRHPESGAAQRAAAVAGVPIVNAGDGPNEHPTQTLLDLMTIQELRGKIDGLKIGLVGDLKYGRVMRSLSLPLTLFKDIELFYVSPAALKMEKDIQDKIKDKVKIHEEEDLAKVIPLVDILYMLRIQKERFKDPREAEKLSGSYRLTPELLVGAKPELKVLHAMPRLEEVDPAVDKTQHAHYFDQVENGMWMRMALLLKILTA